MSRRHDIMLNQFYGKSSYAANQKLKLLKTKLGTS